MINLDDNDVDQFRVINE